MRSESVVNNCVEDAVSFDGFGAGVRQQRKSDASLPAESGERLDWVVANRGQAEPFGLEFREASLQLDQLRLAVGSPVG